MNLVKIATAAAVECERQMVGIRELGFLLEAYSYVQGIAENGEQMNVTAIETLGSFVEPGKNRYGFRKVPVTFANGGSSAKASEIPRLMLRLRDAISDHRRIPADGPTVELASEITKTFLWIHPFADGNGRVGWLLYNYLMGTMDEPLALPDFGW